MAGLIFGEVPENPVGTTYRNQRAAYDAGVHRMLQAGIAGGRDGADSIVVSGGYVDDQDYGTVIIYTGQGGQDQNTGRHIADQTLARGNIGLVRSQLDGRPVRVLRGAGGDPKWSPSSGLRYDGLFRVVDHWHQTGSDGFRIYRFRLELFSSGDGDVVPAVQPPGGVDAPERATATVQRIVRNTKVVMWVKQAHDYTCQVCRLRLVTPGGPYAEGAHIRALGEPHRGPDVAENILCLCPNDHLRFDTGAIYVDSDGIIRDVVSGGDLGRLRVVSPHYVDPKQLAYHRRHHGPA